MFAIGFALMQFLHSGSGGSSGVRANLAGNDCFYHVKMAALLPEIGLPRQFPWLTTTIFSERFVSHHYGFHVLLAPFVLISKSLTGSYVPGAKLFLSITFGLVLAAATLVLIRAHAPARWLWLSLMLVLPADFYIRHAYVRAIDLSLLCQLVGMLLIFQRRYLWAGVVVALYTHLYLGSFFLVIIAVIHFVGGLVDRDGPRADWRLAGWIAAGSVAGFVTHPYFIGSLAFLRTQIFASGLTPEVPVGREWNPYDNAWSFAMLAGVPLVTQGVCIAARMRLGPRLRRNEWTALVTSLFYLGLVLKARRFVEYYPVFAIVSSGMLAGPVVAWWRGESRGRAGVLRDPVAAVMLMVVLLGCAGYASFVLYTRRVELGPLIAWWPIWGLLAGTYGFSISVGRSGRAGGPPEFVAEELEDGHRGPSHCDGGSHHDGGSQVAAGVDPRGCAAGESVPHPSASLKGGAPARWLMRGVFVSAILAVVPSLAVASGHLHMTVRRWATGKRDLDVIEPAMAAMAARSQPGDIVFTDDWDVFPTYFYFNHRNHYITGLDPAFSHRHDPELWQRYVKISRGQTPAPAMVEEVIEGRVEKRSIRVALEDIRDRFGARFVVVDKDHSALRRKLEAAPGFARKIYPIDSDESDEGSDALVVFEVIGMGGNGSSGGDSGG